MPGGRPIRDLRAEDLPGLALANGEPIPTLPDALTVLRGLEVWIEVKTLPPECDAGLIGLLRGENPSLVGVHSFDHRIVARLGSALPGLRRGVLSASYPVDPIAPMAAAGATALWQEWRLIDPELVAAVHRRGWEVMAWTVPETEAPRLAALGVDALCGNYPDRLRAR